MNFFKFKDKKAVVTHFQEDITDTLTDGFALIVGNTVFNVGGIVRKADEFWAKNVDKHLLKKKVLEKTELDGLIDKTNIEMQEQIRKRLMVEKDEEFRNKLEEILYAD